MEPTQSPRSINGEYIMNCSYLSVSGTPFCVQADHRPQAACMNEEEAEQHYKMCAFEDAWREAMTGEVGFQDYWAEEESKYNRRYSVEDH